MSLKTGEPVHCVEFSPFQHSADLLALGGRTGVTVKSCTLQESSLQDGQGLLESLQFADVLCIESGYDGRHSAVAWSPLAGGVDGEDGATALRFSCATSDHKIRYINSDHTGTTTQIIGWHSKYVNSLAAHPTNPSLLASAGDDRKCRVWDLEAGKLLSEFQLKSPCVEVAWHPLEPMKLLAAGKSSGIHFYDMNTEVPIMTLDVWSHTHQLTPPLLSVDWSPSNNLIVGGVANGSWALWDVAQSRYPLEARVAHSGPATVFRWCPGSEQVFATIGNMNQVKVHHIGHQKVPICTDISAVSSLSWHAKLPLLAASGDRSIRFWSVEL
jgi:WD40 repeat protein